MTVNKEEPIIYYLAQPISQVGDILNLDAAVIRKNRQIHILKLLMKLDNNTFLSTPIQYMASFQCLNFKTPCRPETIKIL